MGSRLKQNPEQTFHWFFEAACPVARDKDPDVLFQFPEDFSDEDACQTVPRFCFPYDIQRVREGVAVQHFTFVLTDLEGCQRFGFCRLTKNTHTCLCILSYLPWFEVFYKLLNNLADYLTKGQTSEVKVLLAGLYKQPIPLPAGSVTLQMGEQLLVSTEVSHPVGHPKGQEGAPYFIAPDPRSLPSIPENRNLTELIVAVDVGNLLQVYASMLFERRILIFASKLSTLTSCVHALSAVLYPMYWQHIFIPVLPPHLLDYCCAPMPYLIGVHSSLTERVRSRGLEEVVVLNVDTNTLETPFDDLKRIPSDVMSGLKVCLKRQAVSPGSGVSRAFLKAQALLFGGYRDALQGHKEGEISFSTEMFLDHKSHSMRHFLQSAIHLQFFKQFIDSRLDILNKGKEPGDLFEDEILTCDSTAGKNKPYQQLVGNLKRGGGALILNMKSKANMRAKGLSKSGLKNLLMHKAHNEEHTLHRGGSVSHRRAQSDCLQNRLPITQHFGMSRPRRPVHKHRVHREQDMKNTGHTWDGAGSGPAAEPDPEHQRDEDEEDDLLLCDPEEMDLLGEIFDTLSSRSSHDRGLLYGTRSLDLFGPDSHDYKLGPTNPSQESLCLSTSGSLQSWNLETTEELSDVTEDSDWQEQDTGVPEEEASESLPATCETGKQEGGRAKDERHKVKVGINGNQEEETVNGDKYKEVRFEEERKTEVQDLSVSFGEESGTETCEKRASDERESVDDAGGDETGRETNQTQESAAGEEDTLVEEVVTRSSSEHVQLNPHDADTAEEQQQGEEEAEKPEATAPPRPLTLAADPEPPAPQDNRDEELRKSFPPPTVLSAVKRFQSPASSQSLQVKSWTAGLADGGRLCNVLWSRDIAQTQTQTQTQPPRSCAEAQEDQHLPPIKVSELKKRFEA